MANNKLFSFVALFCSLLATILFPTIGGLTITYTAAPLVMLFYNASQVTCLWTALLCGLFVDAIELSPSFGFLGLSFLLTAQILYPFRLYFFKDSNITLPVMTFFFSFLSGCIELLLALFFDITIPKVQGEWLFVLPVADAVMSMVMFMLPSFLWHQYRVKVSRRRQE